MPTTPSDPRKSSLDEPLLPSVIPENNSNSDSNSNSNRNRANSSGQHSNQYSPTGDYIDEDDDDDDDSYNYLHHNDSGLALEYNATPDDEDGDEEGGAELLLDALAPGEQSSNKADDQFDLCGSMWKRRGGLGRNAERNWVMRCFTLNGPILCYHEESNMESVIDPSKPRARLYLSKIETIAEMHSKQKPGLPSQNLLTINIYDPIVHAKRKWEMCCTSKDQQLLWYNAINIYNGPPKPMSLSIVNGSNAELRGVVQESLSPTPNGGRYPPQLPDISTPTSAPRALIMDDVELIARAAAKAAEIMNEKQQSEKKQMTILSNKNMIGLMIVLLNVIMFLLRNGSEQTYRMIFTLLNALALYVAFQYMGESAPRGPKARAAKTKKKSVPSYSPEAQQDPEQHRQIRGTQPIKILPVGKTIPRATPTKNSELEKVLQTNEPTSAEAIHAYAAAVPNDSVEATPHSYANTDASTFHLRIGPNYKKNKQKAPSSPALYDLISMDFLYADTALKNTADKFHIPSIIPGITDINTGHAHIPPLLIVNTWLPGEEPSMFAKNNTDGETYSIPMVFVLSKDTLEQLKDIDTASPGVKLLSEWCRRAEDEPDFRGRFKCMGMIEGIESTGVPKFIHGYNGKPALVTKSGTFKRHDNYLEFTINVNMWAFLARKGLHTLIPTFPEFVFNIGFTIEARKDEEMPEVLLGGCRLFNLDTEKAAVDGVDDLDM